MSEFRGSIPSFEMGSVFIQSETGLTVAVLRIPPPLHLRTKKLYLGCRVLVFSQNRVRPLQRGG